MGVPIIENEYNARISQLSAPFPLTALARVPTILIIPKSRVGGRRAMASEWAIVIGRFQIFHHHHKALLDRALMEANNVLCILGSYNADRTRENPFLAGERRAMIRACYPSVDRLKFVYAFDQPGEDDEWRRQVEERISLFTGAYQDKPLLVVNCKPGECYLKDIFHDYPQSITYHNRNVCGTDIRERFFRGYPIARHVPAPVERWLGEFTLTDAGDRAFNAHWDGKRGA